MFKLEKYHYVAMIGWAAKFVSIVLSFVNTKLMFNVMGIKGFALFSILASLSGWICLLNFGVPSGLQNIIARYRAIDKSISNILANVFFWVLILSLCLIPPIYLISWTVYKYLLTNYTDLIQLAPVFIIIYTFYLTGISQIFYKILFATHKGQYPNIYPVIQSIISFLVLLSLSNFKIYNLSIIMPIFFCAQLIIFPISFWQSMGFIKPKYNRDLTLDLINASKGFFIFAFLSCCTLGFDYIIMSKLLAPLEISEYNIIMKFLNLIIVLYATLLASSWAVFSEAFYLKNFAKIFSAIKKNLLVGFFIATLLLMPLIIFNNRIFHFFSGGNTMHVSTLTIIFASIYVLIRVWTDTFATVLASINEVKILVKVLPLQTLISLSLQYFLCLHYGIEGIFIALSISFLTTVSTILPISLRKKLEKA